MRNFKSINLSTTLIHILVFLTPVLFTTNTEEAFEFPKMFFVYLLATTIGFLFVLDILKNPGKKIKKPSIPVLGFITVSIIATLFSSHMYTSIWGYYSRFNDGLMSILAFFIVYIVLINKFSQGKLHNLVITAMFSSIPVIVYGIYQHFSLEDGARVYSTFGQPNWLASFLTMLLPASLYYGINNNVQVKFRYISTVIFIAGYASLWFTYSLSGLISLAMGIGTLILLNKPLFKKNWRFSLLVFAFVTAISLMNLGLYSQRVKDIFIDIRKVYAQTETRVETDINNISDPGFIRLQIWKGTINLVKATPKNILIGTGLETFPYEFQRYRPKELNYSSEWDYILNKPHNYYLEVLAETGTLGLIIYSLLIGHTLRKRNKILTPMLVAFYAANFFGWPTVSTSLLFWVSLAGIELAPQKNTLKTS